jgi:hypothetical protein
MVVFIPFRKDTFQSKPVDHYLYVNYYYQRLKKYNGLINLDSKQGEVKVDFWEEEKVIH